jgi:hypothetical protein
MVAIEKQRKLLEVKSEAARLAKPGLPVPYVMVSGAQFIPASDSKASPPPPAPPLLRDWGIAVLRGPGCTNTLRGGVFLPASSIEDAHCVVVDDTAARWHSPEALAARLFGKRLVDEVWITSKTSGGSCFAFRSWMNISTTTLWLSDEFRKQHQHHVGVLENAARCSPTMTKGSFECTRVASHPSPGLSMISRDLCRLVKLVLYFVVHAYDE